MAIGRCGKRGYLTLGVTTLLLSAYLGAGLGSSLTGDTPRRVVPKLKLPLKASASPNCFGSKQDHVSERESSCQTAEHSPESALHWPLSESKKAFNSDAKISSDTSAVSNGQNGTLSAQSFPVEGAQESFEQSDGQRAAKSLRNVSLRMVSDSFDGISNAHLVLRYTSSDNLESLQASLTHKGSGSVAHWQWERPENSHSASERPWSSGLTAFSAYYCTLYILQPELSKLCVWRLHKAVAESVSQGTASYAQVQTEVDLYVAWEIGMEVTLLMDEAENGTELDAGASSKPLVLGLSSRIDVNAWCAENDLVGDSCFRLEKWMGVQNQFREMGEFFYHRTERSKDNHSSGIHLNNLHETNKTFLVTKTIACQQYDDERLSWCEYENICVDHDTDELRFLFDDSCFVGDNVFPPTNNEREQREDGGDGSKNSALLDSRLLYRVFRDGTDVELDMNAFTSSPSLSYPRLHSQIPQLGFLCPNTAKKASEPLKQRSRKGGVKEQDIFQMSQVTERGEKMTPLVGLQILPSRSCMSARLEYSPWVFRSSDNSSNCLDFASSASACSSSHPSPQQQAPLRRMVDGRTFIAKPMTHSANIFHWAEKMMIAFELQDTTLSGDKGRFDHFVTLLHEDYDKGLWQKGLAELIFGREKDFPRLFDEQNRLAEQRRFPASTLHGDPKADTKRAKGMTCYRRAVVAGAFPRLVTSHRVAERLFRRALDYLQKDERDRSTSSTNKRKQSERERFGDEAGSEERDAEEEKNEFSAPASDESDAKTDLPPTGSFILIISREEGTFRRIINEEAFSQAIQAAADAYNQKQTAFFASLNQSVPSSAHLHVVLARLGSLSFTSQLELLTRTAVLIATHGAGLTNMILLPPGAVVIEIQEPLVPKKLYESIAASSAHPYFSYLASSAVVTPSNSSVPSNASEKKDQDPRKEVIYHRETRPGPGSGKILTERMPFHDKYSSYSPSSPLYYLSAYDCFHNRQCFAASNAYHINLDIDRFLETTFALALRYIPPPFS